MATRRFSKQRTFELLGSSQRAGLPPDLRADEDFKSLLNDDETLRALWKHRIRHIKLDLTGTRPAWVINYEPGLVHDELGLCIEPDVKHRLGNCHVEKFATVDVTVTEHGAPTFRTRATPRHRTLKSPHVAAMVADLVPRFQRILTILESDHAADLKALTGVGSEIAYGYTIGSY